jgi:hypothetical protein
VRTNKESVALTNQLLKSKALMDELRQKIAAFAEQEKRSNAIAKRKWCSGGT